MKLNGRVGQVVGPFTANQDLLAEGGPISEFTPQTTKPILYKLGIQADVGTEVKINGATIKIGKTGVYELDQTVNITSLIFTGTTDTSTIVDFVY